MSEQALTRLKWCGNEIRISAMTNQKKTQLVPACLYELLKTLSLIASVTKSSSLIRIATGFLQEQKK